MSVTSRDALGAIRIGRRLLTAGPAALLALGAAPASAQDLVHRFINPSFGGNPFYSDHLLAIANIDRPKEATAETETPTDEDLLAAQIRARLLSQLQGDILDRIQNAAVGTSGNFEVGNQQISYTRTATETRVTFTNTATGETNTVVIPAAGSSSGSTGAASASVRTASADSSAQSGAARAMAQGGVVSIGTGAARATVSGSAEQTLLASSGAGSAALPPY